MIPINGTTVIVHPTATLICTAQLQAAAISNRYPRGLLALAVEAVETGYFADTFGFSNLHSSNQSSDSHLLTEPAKVAGSLGKWESCQLSPAIHVN